MRSFFASRRVLEVDTPILATTTAADRHIDSLRTSYHGPGRDGLQLYLHTSPESAMKRLLAAGSGPIYQVCKVFRDGESGLWHNPEFSMLEWYRPGFDLFAMMDEVEALFATVLPDWKTAVRMQYHELFRRHLDIDLERTTLDGLRQLAQRHGMDVSATVAGDGSRDSWLQLLMTHIIEPQLDEYGNLFVFNFPASQAAMACVASGQPPLASRFELYVNGVELANGYRELTDPVEQRRRILADLQYRRDHGLDVMPVDELLLAALDAGMPPSSGVAVGFDRLVMLAVGADELSGVLTFSLDRV